jgi:DNA-binding NarL/FixJ family response regulator
MKYLFKEHYSLPVMLPESNEIRVYKAVVYEPQMELAQIYAKYLNQQNLETYICLHQNSLSSLSENLSPQILVYNIEGGYELLRNVKRQWPQMLVITIANDFGDTEIDDLMAIGVSGHINRKTTHPQDIGILVKELLQF